MTQQEATKVLNDFAAARLTKEQAVAALIDGGVHPVLAREMVFIASGVTDFIRDAEPKPELPPVSKKRWWQKFTWKPGDLRPVSKSAPLSTPPPADGIRASERPSRRLPRPADP